MKVRLKLTLPWQTPPSLSYANDAVLVLINRIYIRKARGSLWKQGQHQSHFHSKARQLSINCKMVYCHQQNAADTSLLQRLLSKTKHLLQNLLKTLITPKSLKPQTPLPLKTPFSHLKRSASLHTYSSRYNRRPDKQQNQFIQYKV